MKKEVLLTIPACIILVLLVGSVFYAFYFAMSDEKTVGSPVYKIDDALWNAMMAGDDSKTMKVQSSVMRSVSSSDYPIIIAYSSDTPSVDIEAIHAEVTTADYRTIMDLSQDPSVIKIYLDQVAEMDLNLAVPKIGAETFPEYQGGENVKICVLDTGIDKTHYALKTPIKEFDFVNDDSDATDDSFGHGTHVAGILVSSDDKYRGVAPSADLMFAKVFDNEGHASYSNLMRAIQWCVENNADIISLSGSGGLYKETCDQDILAQVANWAVDQGVVFVASAGNKGDAGGGAPACGSKVISVGATDNVRGKLHSWSSKSDAVDVTAVGDVTSSVPNNGWYEYHGTSMACPMVSGSVALLKSLFPDASVDDLRTALIDTAECYRSRCEFGEGNGLVDVYQACLYLEHNGEIPTQTVDGTTYGSKGQIAWASVGSSKETDPACLSYILDGDYLSVSEDHETYYPAKQKCRERSRYNRETRTREYYTYCYEKSSYSEPKNIMFYTEEGYPVSVSGRNGRYTYYVWYDLTIDKSSRDKANAWIYVPLDRGDLYSPPEDQAVRSPSCGVCSQIFVSEGILP